MYCLQNRSGSCRSRWTQLSLQRISIVHDDATFSATLRANVLTIHSTSAGLQLSAQVIATDWGIDVTTAARTINTKIQRHIPTVLHSTLFWNTTSRRHNKCAYLQHQLVGTEHFPCQRNCKHIRDCPLCSNRRGHQTQ